MQFTRCNLFYRTIQGQIIIYFFKKDDCFKDPPPNVSIWNNFLSNSLSFSIKMSFFITLPFSLPSSCVQDIRCIPGSIGSASPDNRHGPDKAVGSYHRCITLLSNSQNRGVSPNGGDWQITTWLKGIPVFVWLVGLCSKYW